MILIQKVGQGNLVPNNQNNQFYQNDLDCDPMTLVLKCDLNMLKIYHHTKNKVSVSRHSKIIAQMGRHTDTQTDRQTQKT